MNTTTRRNFLRYTSLTIAGAGAALTLPGLSRKVMAQSDSTEDTPLYTFPLLGDLHYDLMVHHDMDWVNREKPRDIRQIEGYVASTEKYTPQLFAEVSRQIAAQSAAVPFVVQVGDFVEGLCGSYDLQAKQFDDATGAVEAAALGTPFLITKGNHDITGPGAPEAYDKVLLPWLSQQADQKLDRANYAFKQADDLFVFFDAYKPDLDWLQTTLEANAPARHVFFVIHPPVVPYNERANWIIFARPEQSAQRQRLLNLLGQYRAIVLSGHLHKYSLLTRETDAGSFTHLAILSIMRHDKEQPNDMLEGIDAYGPGLVELNPKFSPNSEQLRREMLEAEKPFIESFEYAKMPGYAMVKVYEDRVDADIYVGLDDTPWKTRDLVPANVTHEAEV